MGARDPRIDSYIEKSAAFAQPILAHLREVVHAACPDVEETMKWSFPHFQYKGMLCAMASFKQHCTFGFWKGSMVLDDVQDKAAMGQFGRIASVKDLPGKRIMSGYIEKAMQLNDAGVKVVRAPRPATQKSAGARVPPDLAAALERNGKARATFDAFSPSNRYEYIEWVTEAKREATRARRVEQAIGMLAEGKTRNWKYQSS